MAKINTKKPASKFSMYLIAHMRAFILSLGKIIRSPFSSFITILVMGLALALPLFLFVLLQNAHQLTGKWQGTTTQISLYLRKNLGVQQVQDTVNQLKSNPEISSVKYISPADGLMEFATTTNTGHILGALQDNPLPGVVVIQPILSMRSPSQITQLVDQLQKLPEVKMAKLDQQWLIRLADILDLAKHIVLALAFLLGLGVLLTIGNTIRLATQKDRDEIAILRLVGATTAFVRRPFIYTGVLYGILSGAIAWGLVVGIIDWLQKPVTHLASTYTTNFYLQGLSISAGIALLCVSIFLGLCGAWLAVGNSLRKI